MSMETAPYLAIPATMLASVMASTVSADSLSCTLESPCEGRTACETEPVSLRFDIDRNQFVDPVDPNEPPRRKITQVEMGARHFPAEPFLIGDVRGFWAEGLGGSDGIFVVNADGSAKYSNPQLGETLLGTCEDLN